MADSPPLAVVAVVVAEVLRCLCQAVETAPVEALVNADPYVDRMTSQHHCQLKCLWIGCAFMTMVVVVST